MKRLLRPEKTPAAKDPLQVDYIKECETALSKTLSRKVTIQMGRKKGKFILEYYGDEDLQDLIDALGTLGQ